MSEPVLPPPYPGGQPSLGGHHLQPGAPMGDAAAPYPIGIAPGAPPPLPEDRIHPIAIVAFVLSFLTGFIGMILGVVALRQCWARNVRGIGLAWAAIILGAVGGVVGTLLIMFLVSALQQQS